MWNMILGFVLGMFSSGIVVILYEYITQPDLIMKLDTKRTQGFHPNNNKPFEFYHVIVLNKPPYFIMPSRKPAWACQARIDVFDNKNTLIIKEVQARWTSQPDPLLPAVAGNSVANLIDPTRIVQARKVDVHTTESNTCR
jgi:hypothetical protein